MIWWKKKSSLVLCLSVLIALLVWSQMGMFMAHLLFGASIKVNFFKFCLSLFKEQSLYYFLVIGLLNVIIAYTVLISIFKITEQYFLMKRFRNRIKDYKNTYLTNMINRMFDRQNEDILVINQNQSLAFTMGFRKPIIVLSSGLLEIMEDDELRAIVEHETFHQKNHDSIKILILQLISQTLRYIPLTKWSYQNYKIISELMADEYAIQKLGSEVGLSSALLKLIKNRCTVNLIPVLVHFSDESVNFRLQQLVSPRKAIPVRLNFTSMFVSIYVLLLLMVMILVTVT
jgi:Zn-dependent protease with chaperone function